MSNCPSPRSSLTAPDSPQLRSRSGSLCHPGLQPSPSEVSRQSNSLLNDPYSSPSAGSEPSKQVTSDSSDAREDTRHGSESTLFGSQPSDNPPSFHTLSSLSVLSADDPETLQTTSLASPQHYDDNFGEENADLDITTKSGGLSAIVELDDLHDAANPYRQSILPAGPSRRTVVSRNDSTESATFTPAYTDDSRYSTEKPKTFQSRLEIEREALRNMDYKQRRKERRKVKIEYNITSVINRQKFLLRLARALMAFGSPSHRIEAQLLSCSKILEVNAEFVHIPGIIICSFGDPETKTSETHFVKCNGGLALGNLHTVHQIYRSVVHDEICAKTATAQLNELLGAPPIYGTLVRITLAFLLSALICPLAFGGSFLDMSVAGAGAIIVSVMQFSVASKSALYANVFEITMAIFMSLTARGLSSGIQGDYFCYTAISSAGIVSILPGYLILTSSLELASKNIVCGSVKMVYALIYTLFLGFGLQIGSDFYLLFDPRARRHLEGMAERLVQRVTLAGIYVTDNTSAASSFLNGTFVLSHHTPYAEAYIFDGCLRLPEGPWYLQPYPWWTQFILVPVFSILSSLANMQPILSRELPVMVVISCAAYAANKASNQFVFNRSDVVSAIGAFVVGVLGNVYSRKMGGTAFTSMVTGVLFLVPSGLSQAGGLTAGSGVDIGGAMIAVTIGITVGLFMSQALVYMFGSRKNAAMFSF